MTSRKTIIIRNKWIIILLLIVAIAHKGYCQTLSGRVTDKTSQEGLQGVNVLLYNRSGSMVKYAITAHDGTFRMAVPDSVMQTGYLQFTSMGYESRQMMLPQQTPLNVALDQQILKIREVVVKAPRVRMQGDTLTYDVRLFSKVGDRSIGDVLKRMPGIKTLDNGQITYNGIPINRFYIENSDLLGGQYGIATQNIPRESVASVEVMQNHQPVRALEGLSFSEQAAINLKLKSGAKLKWIGTLKTAGGFSPENGLWDLEGTLMRFSKNFQSINTLKTNNAGVDVSKEINSFEQNELKYRSELLNEMIRVSPPHSLGLDRERELDNVTHQITSNNLFKLKSGRDIRIGLTLQHHRQQSHKMTESHYFSPDGGSLWSMDETEDSRFGRRSLTTSLSTEWNKPGYNLTEKIGLTMGWNNNDIGLDGSRSNRQSMETTERRVVNDLYWLKRVGNNFFTVASYSSFQSLPQKLAVSDASVHNWQRITPSQIFTSNQFEWGMGLGPVTLELIGTIGGLYRQLASEHTALSVSLPENKYRMSSGRFHSGITPQITFQKGNLTTVLTLPFTYYHDAYQADRLDTVAQSKWLSAPGLYAEYAFSNRLKLYLRGKMNEIPMPLTTFFPGEIMLTYRTVEYGNPIFSPIRNAQVGGGMEYNVPLKEFFSRVQFSHSWNRYPYTVSQSADSHFIYTRYLPETRRSERSQLDFRMAKTMPWKGLSFVIDGMWSITEASLYRNGTEMQSHQQVFQLNPEVEISPLSWLSLFYSLRYTAVNFSIENTSDNDRTMEWHHSLQLKLIPSDKWNLTLKADRYANRLSRQQSRHFMLADLSATYKLSRQLSIDFQLNNLFNEQTYAYTLFLSDATKMTRSYAIRPLNLLLGCYWVF